MTKYGSIPYAMPRFHIPGTKGKGVFLSKEDYLEINSFITFRLGSGGISGSSGDELIITYPNGGETFNNGEPNNIKWQSFGKGVQKVDLHYANGVMHLEIDGRRTNINSQMLIGYYAIGLAISRMNINCTEIEIIISYTIKEKFQIVSRADINLVEKLTKGRISSEQFLSQINY